MAKPDFQEILVQIYNKEISEREVIFNRCNLSITVNLAQITAATYFAKTVDLGSEYPFAGCVVVVMLCVWAFFICKSIWRTKCALTGFQYEEVPPAKDFIKYHKDFIVYKERMDEFDAKNNTNHNVQDPQEATNDYMLDAIADACDANHKTNQARRDILREAIVCIWRGIASLSFVALVFICFDLDSSSPRKDNGVHDKELTAAVREVASTLNNFPKEFRMATTPAPASASAPAPSPATTPNAAASQSGVSPQQLPTPPVRGRNQISIESYVSPSLKEILKEEKK